MNPTPKRTRLGPAERQAHIVEVATRQIGERGFNAFTLSRLAEECGLTRAGIDHHFGSKEAVLVEVLRHRDELDQRAIFGSRTPSDLDEPMVWTVLDDLVQRNIGQPEIVRLYTILDAEALDPEHPAHNFFIERTQKSRQMLSEAARGWHAEPDLFAVTVLGALDGLQLQWLRDPSLDLLALWRHTSAVLRR